MASIKRVVESSSTCGANKARLICDTDGHIQVPIYDWTDFLKDYNKSIASTTKYHVFNVKNDHPYNITLQEHSRAEKESVNISKCSIPEGVFPQHINAKGLDLERQWYELF